MKGKNLDTLFQEKLKNLEVTPNKEVWNNIELKLKNKTPAILPIRWISGGIVAVIILGFLLFPLSQDPILENKTNTAPVIVVAPETNPNPVNIQKTGTDTLFKKSKNQKEIRITKSKFIIKNKKETDINAQQILNESKTLTAEKQQQNTEKENKDLVSNKKSFS